MFREGDRTESLRWFREEGPKNLAVMLGIFSVAWAVTSVLSSLGVAPRLSPVAWATATAILVVFMLYIVGKAVVLRVGVGRDRVVFHYLFRQRVILARDIQRAILESPDKSLVDVADRTKRCTLRISYRDSSRRPTVILDFSDGLKLRIARALDPPNSSEESA